MGFNQGSRHNNGSNSGAHKRVPKREHRETRKASSTPVEATPAEEGQEAPSYRFRSAREQSRLASELER